MLDETALAIQAIYDYWKQIYPDIEPPASEAEIEQLAWVCSNTYKTNEGALATKPLEQKSIHVEIPRALARLYCLSLLKKGDAPSYKAFIEAQTHKPGLAVLAQTEFQTLSETIQHLDKDAYEALRVSTLLLSVTLSPPAKERAQKRLGTYPTDSVEFVATTVERAPDIYPLVQSLTARSIEYLKVACAHHTHFRHMMYMEGGLGMFKGLQQQLTAGTLTQETFNLWYCHWMINITGFRAQIDPRGSLYLNEVTYQDMRILRETLEHYCFRSDDPINERFGHALEEYANKRAQMLGIEGDHKLVLARLGALLRLHTVEEGKALTEGFEALDPALQQSIIEQHQKTFTEDELTPTYGPALFANFLTASNNDIRRTVSVCLPVYMRALDAYREGVSAGRIAPQTPLNFNEMASKASITQLLTCDPKVPVTVEVAIDPTSGLVKISDIKQGVAPLAERPAVQQASEPTKAHHLLAGDLAGRAGALSLLVAFGIYLCKRNHTSAQHAPQKPEPSTSKNTDTFTNHTKPFDHTQRRSFTTTRAPYQPAFHLGITTHPAHKQLQPLTKIPRAPIDPLVSATWGLPPLLRRKFFK